ncbi:hypothetical protein [Bradyrhizobium elkanii]|uniref:hypothetical protein n=1 Tax=Bradyrhizobium elkanii TaxID=29448 RepID=UPI002714BE35|nr:hypothetical protein [Bradyrhizobium elkanii]WLB69828.1 hypothetical protein QIH89_31750 [Bradyrhizobium elkanii]
MVAGKTVCLRRLSRGDRALEVRFNRFLGHDKVTAERIIESWGDSTVAAVEGRHVLAIQDTSEIHFNTTPQRRRGLGEIGKAITTACCCIRCWPWMPTMAAVLDF